MIRLGVIGVDEPHCCELSRRVRGATLVSVPQTSLLSDAPHDVDAVAFLGPQLPEQVVIEHLIAAGTHVLLGTVELHSVEVLDAATQHASTKHVQLVVSNPDRTLPSRRLIFDEIASGKLGVPGLIRIHRWEPAHRTRLAGPNSLPAPLVHDLDLTTWLKGVSPNLVFATGRTGSDESGDVIQVHLGFADGGMALIDYTSILPPGDGYQSLSVICSSGAVYADDHPNRQLVFGGGAAGAEATDEGLLPISNLLQTFIDRVVTGDESRTDVDWWRQAHGVAAAVRRSLQTGRAVMMEDR